MNNGIQMTNQGANMIANAGMLEGQSKDINGPIQEGNEADEGPEEDVDHDDAKEDDNGEGEGRKDEAQQRHHQTAPPPGSAESGDGDIHGTARGQPRRFQ